MTKAAGKPASDRLTIGPGEPNHRTMALRAVRSPQSKTQTWTGTTESEYIGRWSGPEKRLTITKGCRVWSNLSIPFIPISSTSTQDVNVSGNAGYFRAEYVP